MNRLLRLAGVRIAPVAIVGDRAIYGTFDRQRPQLREALNALAENEGGHP